MADLEIRDLRVSVQGKEILAGVSISISKGEVHVLMGPNGSGKSTLAYVIFGHPGYEITGGEIWFKGEKINDLSPDERARRGLFLAFQYPVAIPGVTVSKFMKAAVDAVRGAGNVKPGEFLTELKTATHVLEMEESFLNRFVNDGFSGGEKKRLEVLQMMMLKPEIAVLDETDSGLDIDALKVVARGIESLRGPNTGILLITHYERILRYVKPDHLHIFMNGRIVLSTGPEMVRELEEKGYDWVREKFGAEVLLR